MSSAITQPKRERVGHPMLEPLHELVSGPTCAFCLTTAARRIEWAAK